MREKIVMTIHEAASMLGLSYNTVYEQVRQKRLPALRMGKRWLVPMEDLERYLRAMGNGAEVPRLNQPELPSKELRQRYLAIHLDPFGDIPMPTSLTDNQS